MKFTGLIALAVLFAVSGCSSSDSPDTAGFKAPLVTKTSRESYLNGEKFCSTYSKITSLEYGVKVQVPRDYSDPSKGTLQLYTYTLAPFDASKPSYIYLDGGPGQNTHGIMPNYTDGKFNEIRFDQRGLGCSAPPTYDEYMDASMYSTENTIRDMELIRETYGISKWAVYGVSYGTVPTTMYASTYRDRVTSAVVEGVAGEPETLHIEAFKAKKLNLVYARLTPLEQQGFVDLLILDSKNEFVFYIYLMSQFYRDEGMADSLILIRRLVTSAGKVETSLYNKLKTLIQADKVKFPYEQQPGAVDGNVLKIIYCKSLNGAYRSPDYVTFNNEEGFVVRTDYSASQEKECRTAGVQKSDEKPYSPANFKTTVPFYYFQGAHDGATTAQGAMGHFKVVPQGPTYFLLAERGGHNPNITRMESETATVKSQQKVLFEKALSGSVISNTDLTLLNSLLTNQKWLLYTAPYNTYGMPDYFEGIQRTRTFQTGLSNH